MRKGRYFLRANIKSTFQPLFRSRRKFMSKNIRVTHAKTIAPTATCEYKIFLFTSEILPLKCCFIFYCVEKNVTNHMKMLSSDFFNLCRSLPKICCLSIGVFSVNKKSMGLVRRCSQNILHFLDIY